MSKRSPLLITMGDACGIGPEIIARAFAREAAPDCIVVADAAVIRRAARAVGALAVAVIEHPDECPLVPPHCVPVVAPDGLPGDLTDAPIGRVDARAGRAAARCIEHAAALVTAGQAGGLVTAPIHKEALRAAGVPFHGHTEMLQAIAGGVPVRMMLANDELRVVLVTIHVALRDAIALVTRERVLETIRIANAALVQWGREAPRVAVCGLNPHAGEGGMFGDEEQREIAPAVDAARALGIDASGPHAPDTVFMRARRGEFDVVVAMTHDQGLIPVKYLGVERGVNITLGLPFVRTSPDHGTAFDIAGSGRADASSLIAAIETARRLVDHT